MTCEQGKDDELWHTAIHEAGHAVLTHYLNLGCVNVDIIPVENQLGVSEDGGEFGIPDEDSESLAMLAEEAFFLRHAIVRLAGGLAAKRAGILMWESGCDR